MLETKNLQNQLPFFKNTDIRLLKELGKNKNIVITSPDKGRGVVIMNRKDYDRKMNDILSDRTTFKAFESNEDVYKLALRKEDKINRILKQLKDKI